VEQSCNGGDRDAGEQGPEASSESIVGVIGGSFAVTAPRDVLPPLQVIPGGDADLSCMWFRWNSLSATHRILTPVCSTTKVSRIDRSATIARRYSKCESMCWAPVLPYTLAIPWLRSWVRVLRPGWLLCLPRTGITNG
jgi:hypothetical protein